MLKGWKIKRDKKGNIVHYNPKVVYKYKDFDTSFLNQLKQAV